MHAKKLNLTHVLCCIFNIVCTQVKHEDTEKLKEVQQVLKSNFNADQVQQLPTNFEEIFKICRNYDELFWLGEVNKKKLLVLSAKAALYKFSNVDLFTSKPSAQSRFVADIIATFFYSFLLLGRQFLMLHETRPETDTEINGLGLGVNKFRAMFGLGGINGSTCQHI